MIALTLKLEPIITITSDQLYQICQENPDLKLEKTAEGELIIMSPTSGETGRINSEFIFQLMSWNKQTKLGIVLDSSTGFNLPNGATLSPDAAWITISKWNGLNKDQRAKFLPLCPDFVIEILSPSDSLLKGRSKMQEYINNGCLLGWLINCKQQQVEIYRTAQLVEILNHPQVLSGENILPEFMLNLTDIWNS